MAFESRKNRIAQQFMPDTMIALPVPPNLTIFSGKLILTGSVTIAGATANGTVLGEGGPVNLIQRIRVVVNAAPGSPYPNGWCVDATPRSLLRAAQMYSRFGSYFAEQSGNTLGGGANGTYTIYLEIPISFVDSSLRYNQIATGLYADPSAYQSIQVQVFTGDVARCFTGNNGIYTYNLQLQWQDKRYNVVPPNPGVALWQEEHVVQIGGANQRLFDPAMPQDGAFLNWLIMAEQGAQQTLSDAILQQLTLEGAGIDFSEYAQDIRAEMYDNEWINPAANAAGLYQVDFAEGILQNANAASGLQPYTWVANPSGANLDQLRIFTRRLFTVSAS